MRTLAAELAPYRDPGQQREPRRSVKTKMVLNDEL